MKTKQVIVMRKDLNMRKGKMCAQAAHASMAFLTSQMHPVYVNSEEELHEVYKKALEVGLISHLIIDNGVTEFNGVPTPTCCAIGPHVEEKFEGITNNLPLL